MTVLVPTSSGIAETIQCVVPVAIPAHPSDVCHVILVIPEPPAATPARLRVAAFTVITDADGVVIEMETGPADATLVPAVAEGGIRSTVVV